MSAYLDSSALVKLYVPEAGSAQVSDFVRARQQSVPFSHLHDLELRNGFRLKLFRREASTTAVRASLKLIDDDSAAGLLSRPDLNWLDIFRRAERLSDAHSSTLGCRSLDLLHVASAQFLGSEAFLTFDGRQLELAKKAGLIIVELPVPGS